MTRKQLIVLISSLAALIIVVGAYFLLRNSKFLADIAAGPCGSENPYFVETGKQPVPADLLMSINPVDSQKQLGYKATSSNFICYNDTRVRSYVDSAGRIWFKPGVELAASTKHIFYISKSANPDYTGDLFSDSEIANYPFKDKVTETPAAETPGDAAAGAWLLEKKNDVKYTMTYPADESPAGNDTVKFSLSDNSAETSKTPGTADLVIKSPWVPFAKNQTNVLSGWIKTANIAMPDFDANMDTPNTNKRIYVYYEIERTAPVDIGTLKAGDKPRLDTSLYEINTPVSSDWDFISSNTFSPGLSSFFASRKLTDGKEVESEVNQMRIVIQLTDFNGDVTLANFKQFLNQPYHQEDKNYDLDDSTVEWAPSYWGHFGSYSLNPHEQTNLPGPGYAVTADTKIYLTNGFATYYKDHYDESKIIIADPVVQKIPGADAVIVGEIKDFNSSGNSIIIGDLTNADFKAFADKYYPALLKDKMLQDQGFALSVKANEIIVAGKDMVGSYYGALRVAELLSSPTISQRLEYDYPDLSFRSWLFPRTGGISAVIAGVTAADLMKTDIKLASKLRFNGYLVSNYSEYENLDSQPELLAKYQDLFAYARKYFIDPVPVMFSYGFAKKTVLKADGTPPPVIVDPGSIGRIYVEEKITFRDVAKNFKHNFGRLVQRNYSDSGFTAVEAKSKIPFLVQSADKSITYIESTDGTGGDYIIVGPNEDDLAAQNDASGKSVRDDYNQPSTIERTANSKIGASDTVVMTFNGIPWSIDPTTTKTIDGKPLTGSNLKRLAVRLTSPAYKQYAEKQIDNVANYLQPKYIHINNDEINSIGLDYRDIYNLNGTPKVRQSAAQMLSSEINSLNSYLKTKSSTTQMIFWADMIDGYHRNGVHVYGNPYPQTTAASDLVAKSSVPAAWSYSSTSVACKNIESYIDFLNNKKLNIIGTLSLSSFEPESTWKCWVGGLKKNTNGVSNVGIIAADWYRTRQDAVMTPLLASIVWNNGQTQVTDVKDTTPPVISEVSIENGGTITTDPYQLSAKVTDDYGVAKVELWIAGTLVSTSTTPDVNSVYSFPIKSSNYKNRDIEIKLVAYDTSGNIATDIRTVKVLPDLTTPPAPVNVLPRTGE